MFQESGIKVEKFSNAICYCCLSIDRVLRPLGNYINILCKIMGDYKECTQYTEQTLVCWECLSFLRRTLEFHQKVLKASFMLSSMDLSHFQENNSLSRLGLIWISNNDYTIKKQIILKVEEEQEEEEVVKEEVTNCINNETRGTADDESFEYKDNDVDYRNSFESDDEQVIIAKINNVVREKKLKIKNSNYKNMFSKDNCDKINAKSLKIRGQYDLIPISQRESHELWRAEKQKEDFQSAEHKCVSCVKIFKCLSDKMQHDRKHHLKQNKYVCDTCSQRFSSKQSLSQHCKWHCYKFTCRLCRDRRIYHNREAVYKHFLHRHRVLYVCKICNGLSFLSRADYVAHFKINHMTFICDYCLKLYTVKESLINHIRKHHSELYCKICKKAYKVHRIYSSHMRTFHPTTDQKAYCVECNLEFKTDLLYKRHLRTSVKHKVVEKKSFPCPKCPKIYFKRCTLNYHYNYVHEKKTKFKCEKCQRMFLNGYRLRQHVASVHDKIPKAKNKLCNYCGRGFNTNKILKNHILTHTGERPHKCGHCVASFAQKTAYMYHLKNVHYKNNLS